MKTIKIILNEDGSVKSLTYQFQINQYSYNDTLINIYVPSAILDLNISEDDDISYGNNVEMGLRYNRANGTQKMGNPYLFTFVKSNIVIDNVSYTLFERKMPKEFTLYYGTQTYIINVVATKTTHTIVNGDDVYTTENIGTITSSDIQLLINQSSNMVDNPIETDTDLSTLQANVNYLLSNILLKQDKSDNLIQVALVNGGLTNTSVVYAALNALNQRVNDNYTNIGGNDNDIAQLQQDVIDINTKLITSFRYCGSVTSPNTPTSALLDAQMVAWGLTKKNGDTIIWTEQISGATDKSYTCRYSATGWDIIETPTVESASNTDAGLIKGNYGSDTTSNILASIVGGKIVEMYYKYNGSYYSLSTAMGNIESALNDLLITGNQAVIKSQYATYDMSEYGNPTPKSIDQKYLTQTLGATKQFVTDYALPKQFGDVYFLNTVNGHFESDLNPASTNTQTTLSSIGYGTILDAYLNNDIHASYQLSNKNSVSLSTYIALSTTTSINFRLEVIYKNSGTSKIMCSAITSTYSFTANTYKKIDFTSYLTSLTSELDIANGQYEIKISANMTTSTPITFTIYSTSTLPTSFNLNLYSTSLIIGSGYLGEINYHELTGVRSGGYCNYDMPSDTNLLDNTEHRFLLTIPLDAVDSDVVRIRKGTTNIPIYSNKTNAMYHYFLKSYISYSGKASLVATYYNGIFYLNDEIEIDKISYVIVDNLSGTISNYRYYMSAYDYDYLGIICRDSNSGENVKYIVSDNGSGTVYNLKSTQIFTDANGDFYYTGTINRSSGVYSLGNKVYLSSGISSTMIETTYADLVTAISNDELIAGCWYRITDYVTKIKGTYDLTDLLGQTAYLPYATSDEHPFDILVLATSENTLNENAKAMLHNGDSYFATQNLGAWELKYTVENDRSKYTWADDVNGKGVIYYMKDEYNNSCYYDFKNVKTLCFGLINMPQTFSEFNHDTSDDKYCRYGSIYDVFSLLTGETLQYDFNAKDLSGESMIKTLTLISGVSKTELAQSYDWDTLCAVLSAMAGETIDINVLSYLWNISVADLQAMTLLDFIREILDGDFYYTFDLIDTTDNPDLHYDLSLAGGYCHDNILGHTADALTQVVPNVTKLPHGLSGNVFQTNVGNPYIYSNILGSNSFLNIFGYDINYSQENISNNINNDFSFNKCYAFAHNSVGNRNTNSFFGITANNVIGNENICYFNHTVSYNTIGSGNSPLGLFTSLGNIIGNDNSSLVLNGSSHNVIENNCINLGLADVIYSNIGNHVENVYETNNLEEIASLQYCIIENGVKNIEINASGFGYLMIKLSAGLNNKQITVTRGNTELITYKDTNATDVNL